MCRYIKLELSHGVWYCVLQQLRINIKYFTDVFPKSKFECMLTTRTQVNNGSVMMNVLDMGSFFFKLPLILFNSESKICGKLMHHFIIHNNIQI